MTNRPSKIGSKIVVLILLFVIPAICSGCFAPFYQRNISIDYIINIVPITGETPEDVTLIVPFPTESDGEPIEQVLSSVKESYEGTSFKTDVPGVTFSITETPYGKMLKIEIPKLNSAIGMGGLPATNFNSWFDNRQLGKRFPLSGVKFDKTKKILTATKPITRYGRAHIGTARLYCDYKKATGIAVSQEYLVTYKEFAYPMIGGWGGSSTIIGTDDNPFVDVSLQPYQIMLTQPGWIVVPAMD